MSRTVYTIGYTSFSIDEFINQIQKYNIRCVIDVRSYPVASEFYHVYSRFSLEPILNKNKIIYRNYATEFGARQTDLSFYSNNQLDFQKFIKSKNFIAGIEKIKKGIELGYTFALMCAEKNPINCHRAIMVGKGLRDSGIPVKHILPDKTLLSQQEIDDELLDIYFPNRKQLSLFENIDFDTMIEKAYCFQNKKIGYKIEEFAS